MLTIRKKKATGRKYMYDRKVKQNNAKKKLIIRKRKSEIESREKQGKLRVTFFTIEIKLT